MSEEGKKEAFCPLLYYAGGGRFTSGGRPQLTDGEYRRGVCTRPYDCDTCIYMQHQVSYFPKEEITWICPSCISTVVDWANQHGVHIEMWGFYSEGYCEYPGCQRPEDGTLEQPARYSSFRQIVYGTIR
jgi:hypothetical protein